jgi:hypothetical protein
MKKVALVMSIILVLIVGISFLLKACNQKTEAPDIEKAGYIIHADSRYYLTDSYDKTETHYYLNGWWDYNGTAWKHHTYRLPLLIKSYQSITVERRTPDTISP